MNPRPKYIPRTSETELHLMGNLLDRHQDKAFYATEKLDGFSFSFGWVKGEFVASTRDRVVALNEDSVFGEFLRSFPFRDLPDGYIFQGELIGPGIRENRYELDGIRFFVFDVLKNSTRLDYEAAKQICDCWKLQTVPLISDVVYPTPERIENCAFGKSVLNPSIQREGAIFRPTVETTDEFQGRVSFKVFNPDYPFHH